MSVKMKIFAALLSLLFISSTAVAAKKLSCNSILQGEIISPNGHASSFLDRLKLKLLDMQALESLGNKDPEGQMIRLEDLYGATLDLDFSSTELRASMPNIPLETWKESDGTNERDQILMTNHLRAYARVLGEKDGVRLVTTAPSRVSWGKSETIPIELYLVIPIHESARLESLDLKLTMANEIAFDTIKKIRRAVFRTETDESYKLYGRKQPMMIITNDGQGLYIERILDLYRDDLTRFPSLNNALSVF